MENIIEKVIKDMNNIFEYYFEDFPEIDDNEIWYYLEEDPQTKKIKFKYAHNECFGPGALAIHYYTRGYCALYAKLLYQLFPEGKIYANYDHVIFKYQGEFYDANGKITINENDWDEIGSDFPVQEFSKWSNINSIQNQEMIKIMYQIGKETLLNYQPKQRKLELSDEE